jgi:transcriptional regulator with XRE-family HTH domain
MTPDAIKELRTRLQLTQETFARILGVSFATVNRWENGKAEPTGDYSRVLFTLQQLEKNEETGAVIDWPRVGALSAMAAVAGFSPILTLGAILAPQVIAQLPSRDDPLRSRTGTVNTRQQLAKKREERKARVDAMPRTSPRSLSQRKGRS